MTECEVAMLPEPTPAIVERRETECVLRDGTSLHTVLLIPATPGPWPALLTRHPYDVSREEADGRVDLERFVAAGYLVALQDVRGRYASGGEFDPSAQEVDDGADAVAWLAQLPECTGVVGMWGASYASETQFSALIGGSPALRSIVPAVTPVASGLGGFRFRGGVPEIGSMLAWSHFAIAPNLIARIADPDARAAEQERWSAVDRRIASGELFRAGALNELHDADRMVTWMRDRLREPLDSPSHAVGKIGDHYDAIDVPVFVIGGWFDVFLGSTLEVYRRLRERASGVRPHLLIGPWSHNNMTGTIGGLGFVDGGSRDDMGGDGDLTAQHLRWFDATLLDATLLDATLLDGAGLDGVAPVRLYLMGADRWIALNEFPPAGSTEVELFLTRDGGLDSDPGPAGTTALLSDPADPVPTRGGATLLFPPYESGPIDQSSIEARPDVVSWRTEPLDDEVTVLGGIRAVIHLATTGTDADLVARLCDEYPDGRSLVIVDGIQRASARAVDETTGAGPIAQVIPGQIEEYLIDLWATAHVFQPGHRIRVDVTSSSSPRWEVAGTTVAEYTLHVGADHPSRLVLTVPPALREFGSTPRITPQE